MNDFQRLLERERLRKQERGNYQPSANTTPGPGDPHVRIESWRETDTGPVLHDDIVLREPETDDVPTLRVDRPSGPPVLECRGLRKSYHKSSLEIPVLRGVDLCVYPGEFVAIVGQSGCGKSTLLHLLATLDRPDSGEICYQDKRIDNLRSRARDLIRNRQFGMIFQFYHLLPELTTLENVLSPLMISQGVLRYRWNRRHNIAQAQQLLEQVGLTHRMKHKPRELSGGEMQRAAIARALISQPQILLADEPTGNLDQGTGQEILQMLRGIARERKLTTVMVTHDPHIAAKADRIVRLTEGRVAAT